MYPVSPLRQRESDWAGKSPPPLLRTSLQINHALYDEPGFDAAAVAFDCLLAKAAGVVGRALIAARRHAVAAPHTLVVISLAHRRVAPAALLLRESLRLA